MNDDSTITIELVTTSLEMHARPPTPTRDKRLDIRRALVPNPPLNRFLYATVGADWLWYVRRSWTYDQWHSMVSDPAYQTWVAYIEDSPAGYFELDNRNEGEVEIAFFGLMPAFIGKGLGTAMINECVQHAWNIKGTKRVWVHTDTCDHPRALPNYQTAGFVVCDTKTYIDEVPRDYLEPWTGAGRVPVNKPEDFAT